MNIRNVAPPSNPLQELNSQKRTIQNTKLHLKDHVTITVALLNSLGFSAQATRLTFLQDQIQKDIETIHDETIKALDQAIAYYEQAQP